MSRKIDDSSSNKNPVNPLILSILICDNYNCLSHSFPTPISIDNVLTMQYYLGKIFENESMTSYIKSKIQQSISFLPVMVMAFSVCSGVVFFNPSPSYGFRQEDVDKARSGEKNLVGADLSGANLIGANLSEASLSGANLSGANLIVVDLSGADLSGASLSGANLSQAMLLLANLSGANLSGANLSKADLTKANLTGANLSKADLSRADLSRADLSGLPSFKIQYLIFHTLKSISVFRASTNYDRLDQATRSHNSLVTNLSTAQLNNTRFDGAIADKNTKFPEGFDAAKAGVTIK